MKNVSLSFLLLCLFAVTISCGNNDQDTYTDINTGPVSPVVMDLNQVPYDSLSHYNFFEGTLKNLQPVYGVLPYDLNSSLFTDYALKKRFVWMPAGSKATYNEDGKILDFPIGTVLIKTFYYDPVAEGGTTDLVETRLMIKKGTGWIFANFVWNDDKTAAVLSTQAITRRVAWLQDGVVRQTNYKIPATNQCALCHANNDVPVAIGPKPQNLNKSYTYADGTKNQLAKWVEFGYLDTAPATIASTVDWTDTSKPLELRVRSYLDINCAHCHTDGAYCSYTPMNFAFNKSGLPQNLGICRTPVDFVSGDQQFIVAKGDADGSLLQYRMSNNLQSEMMPQLGRTVVHQEALQMIEDWINSLEGQCQ